MSETFLRVVDRACVVCTAAAYVVSIAGALLAADARAWGLIVVPGLGFLIISLVRARINAPRPYELAAVNPLLDSSTHGKSFPSRHVGSGALIGSSLLWLNPPLGATVLALALVLAIVRVQGRVHFIRDVVAGYAAGFLFGLAGMALLDIVL